MENNGGGCGISNGGGGGDEVMLLMSNKKSENRNESENDCLVRKRRRNAKEGEEEDGGGGNKRECCIRTVSLCVGVRQVHPIFATRPHNSLNSYNSFFATKIHARSGSVCWVVVRPEDLLRNSHRVQITATRLLWFS